MWTQRKRNDLVSLGLVDIYYLLFEIVIEYTFAVNLANIFVMPLQLTPITHELFHFFAKGWAKAKGSKHIKYKY